MADASIFPTIRRASGAARRALLRALGRTRFGTVTSVTTTVPHVALTFDDGPDPHWTPLVLDVLATHGARATFFVLGERAERHPELVRRIHDEGHALGNHSHAHPSFPMVSSARRRAELRRCDDALAAFPQRIRMFRPPHLDQDLASRFDTWRHGYVVVACNRHVRDWEVRHHVDMTRELLEALEGGDIVLLHDSLFDRSEVGREEMLATLDAVLARTKDRYRFVTVPDLLDVGRPQREIWIKRPKGPRSLTPATSS